MPYEGEFAAYKPLRRIAESDRVKTLLKKARTITSVQGSSKALVPKAAPVLNARLPDYAFAIDGSYAEVDIKNG